MKKLLPRPLLLCSIFLLASCANQPTDIASWRGSGESRIYNRNYDAVWDMTVRVVERKFRFVGEGVNKDTGTIYGSNISGGPLLGYTGGLVGVWVEKITEDSTKVEVVSRPHDKVESVLFGADNDWSRPLLDDISKYLE